MYFKEYILSLGSGVPRDVYLMLCAIFCVGSLILMALRGFRVGGRNALALLLGEYIFLLFSSTVLFRNINFGERCCFVPFWSYVRIWNGIDLALVPQNIMNVVAFLPVGFLGGCVFRKHAFAKVLLLGFVISLSIETMQYLFQRGFSEFDDVFHNTLGTIMGYGIFSLCRHVWARRDIVMSFSSCIFGSLK